MQKFYIHKDDQQQGPFSTDELKDLKITRDTMVWFEGADNWKKAIEVDDLKEIFKSVPPPIQTNPPVIPPPLVDKKTKEESKPTVDTKPKKKNTTLIIVVVLLLVGGLGTFIFINQQAKQAEIQRQLEEQNIKIQEQEKIEAARLAEEERQKRAANAAQRQAELESLKYDYDQAVTNLRAEKIRLNEIQQFELLRTASEKQQQVQRQLETIRSWENEVDRLQKEINKY